MATYRQEPAAAAASPSSTWTTWSPTGATKADANAIEDASPTADGDGWVTLTLDTTTNYIAPGDWLAYLQALDLDWGNAWRLDLWLEVRQATETDILVAALVSDSTTLTGADGVYMGVKEETAGNFDYWSRDLSTTLPATGSVAGDPIGMQAVVVNGSGGLYSFSMWLDQSTTPPTQRAQDGLARSDTGVPTSGTPYLGLAVASQAGGGGASRTVEARLRYRLEQIT